jgi:hypothetical protein
MLIEDMDEVMHEYFRWAATNSPDRIGYPSVEIVARLRGSVVSSVALSDDEALHIDRALNYLKQENPGAHRLIRRVYGEHKTIRWMEARGEGDRRAMARLLAEGREFVKGVLIGVGVGR